MSRELIGRYMKREIEISEVVDKFTEEKDGKISAYLLFESIHKIEEGGIEVHERALRKFFRKEYIPGIFSEYIRILVDKKMNSLHRKIRELMEWVLERISNLKEVAGLEERLIVFISTQREEIEENENILKYSLMKSTREGSVHFLRIVLEERRRGIYTAMEEERFAGCVEEIVEEVFRESRLAKGIEKNRSLLKGVAEYRAEILHNTIKRSIEEILKKETEKENNQRNRKILVEWLREIKKTIMASRTEVSETVEEDGMAKEESSHIKTIACRRKMEEIDIVSRVVMKKGAKIDREIVDECASGESVLLMAEICEDSLVSIRPGSELSERIFLKILEVTGDKWYINNHPVRKLIEIEKEIAEKYDYYLSYVFREKTGLKLSLNIINAIVEYGHYGRITGLAVELSNMLKRLEYSSRERFLIGKRSQEIEYIPKILTKIIKTTHFRKIDLKKIYKSTVYLITTGNDAVAKEIYPVLESILYSYRSLDRGIHKSMYGMRIEKPQQAYPKAKEIEQKQNGDISSKSMEQKENVYDCMIKDQESSLSSSNNAKDNALVISAEIFNILNEKGFDYSARKETISLLGVMVEITEDFLVRRIEESMLPDLLYYYTKNNLLVNTAETKSLVKLLSHIVKYQIKTDSFLSIINLLLILVERNIDGAYSIMKELFSSDKYSLFYGIYHCIRIQHKRTGISEKTKQKIMKIFTQQHEQ